MFLRRSNKSWNRGDWKDHAQAAWNHYQNGLRKIGIELRRPSRLSTYFVQAEGTLGGGNDRFPYVMQRGSKVGGWWIGGCNSSASTHLVREANGFWNRNIATHEVGHHADHHARCNGGHPAYMRQAGAPHWPYWNKSRNSEGLFLLNYHTEIEGKSICMTIIEDANDITTMSSHVDKLEDLAKFLIDQCSEEIECPEDSEDFD